MSPSTSIATIPVPPSSPPQPVNYSVAPLVALYGVFFAITVVSAIAYTHGVRRVERIQLQRSIQLLEQRATLERILQVRSR